MIIEFFRPDQPKIPGLGISYSSIFAALMAITGIVLLMARYKAINLKFAENWEEEYKRSMPQSGSMDQVGEKVASMDKSEEPVEEKKTPRVRKAATARANSTSAKRTAKKMPTRKTTKKTEVSPPAARAKKTS